jgi:hypothetical protein
MHKEEAMVSKDRNNWFNLSGGNVRDHFQEHDRCMRAFRLAHPRDWRRWGRRMPEAREKLPALGPTVLLLREAVIARYMPN